MLEDEGDRRKLLRHALTRVHKAFTIGCAGTSLSADERSLIADERPWGLIIFGRNVADGGQLADLVSEYRSIAGPERPVLIDQEGGRVQRLRPPLAPNYPAAWLIGQLYGADSEAGKRAAWLQGRLHAFDLSRFGIDIACLPVLDLPVEGAHEVIGQRAYGPDPRTVAAMGRAVCDGLLAGGVLPVLKHVPGHGRAPADSHKQLPRVDAALEVLRAEDFAPFRQLADMPIAMTAHVVYEAIDPQVPATTSQTVVDTIIRGEIGFDGLLLSDDVSMNALSGDDYARVNAILSAGCDVALHCSGVLENARLAADAACELRGKSLKRAASALARRGPGDDADEDGLRAEYRELTGYDVSFPCA